MIQWSVRSEGYYKNRMIHEDITKQYIVSIKEVEVNLSINKSHHSATLYLGQRFTGSGVVEGLEFLL